MFIVSRFAAFLSGALLAVAAVGTAHAEYVDPPSRVARLSYTRGDVSFSPGGESDWVTASRNRPLIRGDRLWTDRGALAELQAGNATFRVDEGTSLSILNLNDDTAQVEITQGTLNLRVRRIYDNQIFEVDTPTLAFVVSRPGEYRIDVDPRGNHTTVAVWDGGGEAYGDKANFRIKEGEAIRFYDNKLADYEVFDIPRPDEFDRFCQDRDASADRSVSRRYVSEDLIGYSDLDEYGSWTEESDYGAVWYPSRVAADWAPYRDGHWIWQEPWGWTWVDDSSWGFAPFHYGRWAYVRNRWGWIPGPIASRPVYAPALVAFVGGGVSVGISVGRPIGWFPLGPREVYVPPYRTSRRYFTSVNVTNTTINNVYITNIYDGYSRGRNVTTDIRYVNRGINGAVTAVSGDTFINSRSVRQARVTLDRDMAVRGETSQIAAIAPVNRSVLGAGNAARAVPQRDVFNRSVVARTAPARDIAPFAERQQALQRTPGRALEPEQLSAIQQRDRAAPAGRDAGAPQRIRVIDDNAARAARTIDAQPGDRGGAQRTRGPENTADGRGMPNRDAAVPGRGAPPDAGRDRAPVERGAQPDRGAAERGQPSRDAGANRVDRDFTRPNVREQRDGAQRQPISREQFQRDEAQPRDAQPSQRIQREQVQRDQAQQREQMQRDDGQRQQVEREAQQQRNREQAQREDMQRQREQEQQREQARQRDDSVRRMRDEAQQRDEQQQRQREQAQQRDEAMQRQREQNQQREEAQQRQREQAQQREDMQRQQVQREEQQQRQREQAQQRDEAMQRQREQNQQREAQQQQMRQAQEQQRAQQDQQRAAQQQQREQQRAERQQQRDAPQKRDGEGGDNGRRRRDDGDNR